MAMLGLTMLTCLAGTSCPIYPDSPLFGGGGGGGESVNVRLEPGDYTGSAACTQFFQSRGRAPTLDAVEATVRLTVSDQREVSRDGVAVMEGADADLTLGIFTLDRSVTRVSSTSSELIVNLAVSVDVRGDQGTFLELAGVGSETYEQDDADHVLFRFATQLTTADASQEVLDMAFDCSAKLERR